jgi:DNA repair protein RadC
MSAQAQLFELPVQRKDERTVALAWSMRPPQELNESEVAFVLDYAKRAFEAHRCKKRSIITSWSSLLAYVRIDMAERSTECFRVLFLDKKNGLIEDVVMNEGTVDHAPVYPREVVKRALQLDASAVILVHNHPSGDPTPSAADIDMTRQVIEAGRALKIAVHDHLVVGRDGVASFKALGLI